MKSSMMFTNVPMIGGEEVSEKKKPGQRDSVKEPSGFYDVPERFEIIEGVRYDFLASPKITHQVILTSLYNAIHTTCSPSGIIIVAPMDVHLDSDNIVQPDLIFILNENLHIIQDGWVKGVPDLLVEILSPSTGSRDKVRKKALYERFGVKEYWIVDPGYFTVDQLVLADGKYQLAATYGEEDTLTSPYFACMSINLIMIFQEAARFREQPAD